MPVDPRFYQRLTRKPATAQSVLAVPLRNFAGEIIGTFEVLNKRRGAFGGRRGDPANAVMRKPRSPSKRRRCSAS
jgi:hypothetical protein